MSSLGKIKGFISDTVVYGIGSIFSRAFAFFLIPLYTTYLDKVQYGNLILLQIIFTLLSYAFALNSGVFFYYHDGPEVQKKTIFTSWLAYESFLFLLILILAWPLYLLINPIFSIDTDQGQGADAFWWPFFFLVMQLLPFFIYNTYFNLCRIRLKPKLAVLLTFTDALLVILFVVYFLKFRAMGVEGVMLGQLVAKSVLALGIVLMGFYRYFDVRRVSLSMVKKLVAYSWPYFLISTFTWVMNSADKVLGTQLLDTQEGVAYLGLAMQITLPVGLLVDVIRQSFGPYVMSIKSQKDAKQSYKEIFSFVIYVGALVSIIIITLSPFLVDLLADESYYATLDIIPLFVLASVVNMMLLQFSLGLGLTKKNVYIAIGTIVGGLIGLLLNIYLQPRLGIMAAGIVQIMAYTVAAIIIYTYSRKFMPITYNFRWALGIVLLLITFVALFYVTKANVQHLHLCYTVLGLVALLALGWVGERKYKFSSILKQFYGK